MKKLPIILIVLTLTMFVSTNRQAIAGCMSSTQCQNLCDEYCASKNSTCQKASLDPCDANGQQKCNVLCKNGSGYHPTCSCSGGGGSPIFRKQEIGPPPEPKKDGKQTTKTSQPAKADSGQCPGSKQPS